jgi:hypothetical protein
MAFLSLLDRRAKGFYYNLLAYLKKRSLYRRVIKRSRLRKIRLGRIDESRGLYSKQSFRIRERGVE